VTAAWGKIRRRTITILLRAHWKKVDIGVKDSLVRLSTVWFNELLEMNEEKMNEA
jgi:hypothetical protein